MLTGATSSIGDTSSIVQLVTILELFHLLDPYLQVANLASDSTARPERLETTNSLAEELLEATLTLVAAITELVDELVDDILGVIGKLPHQRYPCFRLDIGILQRGVLLNRRLHAGQLRFERANLTADAFETATLIGEQSRELPQQGTQRAMGSAHHLHRPLYAFSLQPMYGNGVALSLGVE